MTFRLSRTFVIAFCS